MDARYLPKAIQWYEGMLLSPQHFQRLSFRQEELTHYRMTAALPFGWGIKNLEIDKSLLTEGIYRISELEAIMPDGTIVWHSADSSDTDLRIDVNHFREQIRQEPLMIYLAVPAKRISASKGITEIYNIDEELIFDENTGESETSVPCLTPKISLLTTQEPTQKYSSFPIAQFAYKNEQLDLTEFTPPRLFSPVKSDIGKMCSEITKKIREKSRFLSDQVSNPSSVIKGSLLFETRFQIHSMIVELPRLEALLNTGKTHPYSLYLSFCALAGHVSSLNAGQMPPVFKPYDHDNMYPAFKDAYNFITEMLDNIRQDYKTVLFETAETGKFTLKIEKIWLEKDGRTVSDIIVGLRRKPAMSADDVKAWMSMCKIYSMEDKDVERSKTKGAAHKLLENVEGIMPGRDIVLFSIAADDYVKKDQVLQIVNSLEKNPDKIPAEVILYVKIS